MFGDSMISFMIRVLSAGLARRRSRRRLFAAMTIAASACAVPVQQAAAQDGVLPQEGRIAGIVSSEAGPEAGVWVVAETTDLPTPYIKIVVTDDDGRFVLPELPMVNYHVW